MDNELIKIGIYVEDNSEDRNLLYKTRGYRRDVYVKFQEKFYKINVFSFKYLNQYLKNQYELEKRYSIEANLLIVKSLSKNEIITTILKEAQNHYFDELKECQVRDGEIIYPLDEKTKNCYKEANWAISFSINKLIRIY